MRGLGWVGGQTVGGRYKALNRSMGQKHRFSLILKGEGFGVKGLSSVGQFGTVAFTGSEK